MTWNHIRPQRDTGLTEQWIKRAHNAPLCSLKRDPEVRDGWQASLLKIGGIACTVYSFSAATLTQAQAICEGELALMGWELGSAKAEA